MKKVFLLLTMAATLAFTASAQKAPIKFGVKAGVAFPNMVVSAMGASVSLDSKTSYYVGGTVDIPVSPLFSVQPGLTLINKGTKVTGSLDIEDGSEMITGTLNFMYIEIPVNGVVSFKAGNAGKVFLGAGPYYAIAVDANAKADGKKEDIKLGTDFKRGDFGLNFLAGFQLNNGLNFHGGYGLGLSNTLGDNEAADYVKFKNRVFTLGVGFTF